MPKLFSVQFEEMSQDILDMGLLNEAEFKEKGSSGLNDSIVIETEGEDTRRVNVEKDNDIEVLDLVKEKLPVTDIIVTVNE